MEQYDTDKQYPVYGFGGKNVIQPFNTVSHCFALNGNIFNPEVQGIAGVAAVYRHAINKIELSGPTYFGPILEYVSGYCMSKMQEMS